MDENLNKNEMSGFDSANSSENGYSISSSGGFFTAGNADNNASGINNSEPVFDVQEQENVSKENFNFYGNMGNDFSPVQKPKKSFNIQTVIVSVIAAVLAGAVSGFGVASVLISYNNNVAPDYTESSQTTSGSISGENINIVVDQTAESVIEAVATKVTPSVVGIRTTAAVNSFFGSSTESTGEGSGVVYRSDGYIITNYHVVESAIGTSNSAIEVYFNNDVTNAVPATVVGYNISYDLAVIKVQSGGLAAIELGDSTSLKVGQYVAAIGNPGGLEFMGSVTYGIISGLNRTISDSSTSEKVYLIQTDAAINPGNSGGALVNTKGQLVGINSSKIVSESYEGMGFAIPVASVKEICDKIIDKEYDPTPYIGITISERYDSATLKELGYPVGAVVQSVVSGGPADEGGIRRADIITEFNGVEITDYTVLTDAIAECKPGQTVSVKIYRSGRYYSTTIKIGANNAQ